MKYRYITILLILLAFTGCSSKSNFYQLHPKVQQSQHTKSSMKQTVVGIGEVEVPEYLKKSEVVTRLSAGRVEVHEVDRWAGSFSNNIQSVIHDNISRLLTKYIFISYPWEEPISDDYRIYITVNKFDGNNLGEVRLEGRWSLVNKDSNSVLINESFAYTETGGITLDEIVDTQSHLLERLSRRIAQRIARKI
jgi:uncharacterized lipoprotein YmbA